MLYNSLDCFICDCNTQLQASYAMRQGSRVRSKYKILGLNNESFFVCFSKVFCNRTEIFNRLYLKAYPLLHGLPITPLLHRLPLGNQKDRYVICFYLIEVLLRSTSLVTFWEVDNSACSVSIKCRVIDS